MTILRNQRTYPLSLKATANYSLNVGVVSAYDYAGDPANAYAGGNGAPHVGSLTLAHAGSPAIVSLNSGQILARDTSQGKTVITPYTGLTAGTLGMGAADGKGTWTIHRRYRAPSAYSGTSANRTIATYRDGGSSSLAIYLVESTANPWCFFFVEAGASSPTLPISTVRTVDASLRIPYSSIVDLHIVRNIDTITFYLNGVPVATRDASTWLLYNTNWTGIPSSDGVNSGNPSDLLLIDHTIWNRALSDAEVTQHKNDPYASYVNSAVVADGITIISPAAGSTVNSEGFTVQGTYQGGSPTSIQAQFNGGAWATIVNNPTGGSYAGTMPAVISATGTLNVRYGNNTAVAASVTGITANPPAPSVSITSQPAPDGQSVTINTSFQRANNVTYNLVTNGSGAVSVSDTVAATYATTVASGSKTFVGVAPGEYTVNVIANGPIAQTTATGTPFSILGVSGGGAVDTPTSSATASGAPTNLVATATATGAVLIFNPPANDGGSPVNSYTFTASTGQQVGVTSSPATFTLPKGVPVSFTGVAINNVGPSAASAPSNTVTPATEPGAPTSPVATIVAGGVSVAFAMPVDNGGYPITASLVTASTGQTAEGTTSPVFIAMPDDATASFKVKVQNAIGYGPESEASNTIVPVGVPPGAVTGVIASARNGYALVYGTAPASSGTKPITRYRATASSGEFAESDTPAIRVDVPRDVAVTFTMTAISGIGASAPSAPSAPVTPRAPVIRLNLKSLAKLPMSNLNGLRWSVHDEPTLDQITVVRGQGAIESTDALGELVIELPGSTKWLGDVVWLTVTNSAGDPKAKHQGFAGPVELK